MVESKISYRILDTYNRTVKELKSEADKDCSGGFIAYNRTVKELKSFMRGQAYKHHKTYNRTVKELK